MATIQKVDVYAAPIEDRPGALAEKLTGLAEAGIDLAFVISRRTHEQPGGVVFVTPIKGARQLAAAKTAGFHKADSLHSLRVEGNDWPGVGAAIATAIAQAGINLRGISAAAFDRIYLAYLAFDMAEDAAKAMKLLKKLDV